MTQSLTNSDLGQRIKDLEQKLHQVETSGSQYRYLVDSTSDFLYLVDEQGRYVFINDNHLQRLNLPAEKIVGCSYNDFHPPQESEDFAEKVRQVFTTGQSIQDEHSAP